MDWLESIRVIVATVGVPVACLVGLGAGVYFFGRFAAVKVLEPLVNAHINFLASVLELLQHVPTTQREHSASLAKIEALLKDQAEEPSA